MNLHSSVGINVDGITTSEWFGRDNQLNFDRLPESHKKLWENIEIVYEINEYGFRGNWTKESVENMGDYALILGSSDAFGQGLPVSLTWPYIVQSKIGIPSINLGSPGLSIDASLYNLVEWITHINNKPKHIVWSWSSPERYFLVDANKMQLSVYARNIESIKKCIGAETCYTLSSFLLDYNLQISELVKIKHITNLIHPKPKIFRYFHDHGENDYSKLGIPNMHPLELLNFSKEAETLPKARDGEHWGIEVNRLVGEAVYKEFF